MNVGPGNMEQLTSEQDYMKMGGNRVSDLFRSWVLKTGFNIGASALHSWVQTSWGFCTRFVLRSFYAQLDNDKCSFFSMYWLFSQTFRLLEKRKTWWCN